MYVHVSRFKYLLVRRFSNNITGSHQKICEYILCACSITSDCLIICKNNCHRESDNSAESIYQSHNCTALVDCKFITCYHLIKIFPTRKVYFCLGEGKVPWLLSAGIYWREQQRTRARTFYCYPFLGSDFHTTRIRMQTSSFFYLGGNHKKKFIYDELIVNYLDPNMTYKND